MLMGQVKLRGMGQRNIAMTSFIAPQVGPSMSPAFLFAADAPAQTPAQAPAQDQNVPVAPIAPTPVVPAPVIVPAPVVETTPAVPLVSIGKQIAGPVIVVAIVAGLVAWKA
jgi:hypothetical protein